MNNAALTANTNEKVNLVKSIANKTRGPYTPEKYGNVIIPMAIIRRFDCILAKKNKEIAQIVEATSKIKGMTPEKVEEMERFAVPFQLVLYSFQLGVLLQLLQIIHYGPFPIYLFCQE